MSTRLVRAAVGAFALGCLRASLLPAQTDYYNTDAGRPIRVEDAYAIERRALELQIAPLRLERPHQSGYRWGIDPEIALGLLPRTHVGVGLPLIHVESSAGNRTALAGVELSAFHTFNAETALPAFAMAATVVLPAGGAGPSRAIPSLKAIATRTFPWFRVHANVQTTFASASSVGGSSASAATASSAAASSVAATTEFTRWLAGVAVDRAFPLQSLLITGEIVASKPLTPSSTSSSILSSTSPLGPVETQWDAAGGARYQLTPRLAVDAGGGYRFRGHDTGWFVTTGAAVSVGLPMRATPMRAMRQGAR